MNFSTNIEVYNLKYNSAKWGWSDLYGANYVASNFCKLSITKDNNFFWHHGIIPPWTSTNLFCVNSIMKDKSMRYFVSSSLQVDVLKKHGFIHSFAIGLPIIYVEVGKINRIPNSLLIMPSHSLLGQAITNESNLVGFINKIKEIKQNFDYILVCLHKNDLENNYWVKEFEDLNIQVIQGAQNDDKNALLRMTELFNSFETVLTNEWGSHVGYALYFGCKVSILDFSLDIDLSSDVWKHDLESLKFLTSEEVIKERDLILKKFYVDPIHAVADVDLGKELVGYKFKVSPLKMRFLFGWSLIGNIYWKIINFKYKLNFRGKLLNFFKS